MSEETKTAETAQANAKLLSAVAKHLGMGTDAALSRVYEVSPAHISRVRSGNLTWGPSLLWKTHKLTGWSAAEIEEILGKKVQMDSKEIVQADLIAKVSVLADDFKRMALEKLSMVDKSCGVLQDHQENGCSYLTARNYASAAAKHFSSQVLANRPDRKTQHMVRQYELFM
jgi:hypothetical protein